MLPLFHIYKHKYTLIVRLMPLASLTLYLSISSSQKLSYCLVAFNALISLHTAHFYIYCIAFCYSSTTTNRRKYLHLSGYGFACVPESLECNTKWCDKTWQLKVKNNVNFFHDNSSRLQFQRKHTTHNTTEHQQHQQQQTKCKSESTNKMLDGAKMMDHDKWLWSEAEDAEDLIVRRSLLLLLYYFLISHFVCVCVCEYLYEIVRESGLICQSQRFH